MHTPEETTTLAELLRQPGERALRGALLLLLTFTAGWMDAIAYVELGHVFTSFMSGNLLFLGLSAVHGERPLLLRTTVALVSFTGGAFLGALFLGSGPARRTRGAWLGTLAAYMALDGVGLACFGIASASSGDTAAHPAAQLALVAVAAFTMGPVGIAVGALGVPGVVASALTGTLLQLAQRFGEDFTRRERTNPLRTTLLLALCLTYATAAALVTLGRGWTGRVFVPAAILAVVALVLFASRSAGGIEEHVTAE